MTELGGRVRAALRRALGPEATGVVLLLTLTLVLQVDFAVRDTRLPHDSNAALLHVPAMAAALAQREWRAGLAPVLDSGGWQELCVAGVALASGRSPLAWHAWFTGWLLLAGIALVRAARAVREDAGLPALALFLGFPVVWEEARVGWLHLPELALLLLATSELLGGAAPLSRARAVRIAIAVALLGSLRGSGLVWGGLVAVAALARVRGSGSRVGLVAILVALGVGLLVTGRSIPHYAAEKLAASSRYGFLGGARAVLLLQQSLGVVETWVVAFAVGLGATGWPPARRPALVALLLLGLAIPLVSMVALASPVTNTPAFLGAAALLGGVGLATLGRWGVGIALVVSVPVLPLQFVPQEALEPLSVRLRWSRYVRDDPQNYQRPHASSVAAGLVDPLRACAARHQPCFLVTEAGLFGLTPEEPGRLELYFLGFAPDDFILLSPVQPRAASPVDVVARYSCASSAAVWGRRHPEYGPAALALIASHGLTAEREIPSGPGCRYLWNTRPDVAGR